eukprot:CAMPEP_0205924000 /NCGR_PEP_ID=MMETSP1325-20131115/16721_1 /ASSEMBLY_ACC=CAM_ASM_000708 /TAXON_ID=236786 /ORGANISM="Florenciella sp., Strain RCC1007" /LENGTH=128 /DNA_ID=CAMNT_0053292291 /DNA_START=123 /DNA_END=510 /DNA_ORIENTATION=+
MPFDPQTLARTEPNSPSPFIPSLMRLRTAQYKPLCAWRRRDSNRKKLDGAAVVQGHQLILEEDHAPHERSEPEPGEVIGRVLSDDDRVRHWQQADHSGVHDEVHDCLLVHCGLRAADKLLYLRHEVLQ